MPKSKTLHQHKWLRTARTISEALPFMRRYAGKTFVIKYGGHAMVDPELADLFARDIVLLKQIGIHPVVVHGGGPQINATLERFCVQSTFVDGLRVTDKATVDIVEMVLSGRINKQITAAINRAGGTAVGLSGKDGNFITAQKLRPADDGSTPDLGFVGQPAEIQPAFLKKLETAGMIPVIAPLGVGADGETYNINADTVAGAVAAAVGAARLLLMTDVPGVLNKEGQLMTDLSVADCKRLRQDGTISGGMIPKLETCLTAVQNGVEAAVILDGCIAHGMLLEIFTERGLGSLVRA